MKLRVQEYRPRVRLPLVRYPITRPGPDELVARVQLTSLPDGYTDYYPQWSPDGRYIIFQRAYGDTAASVFRIRADGSDGLSGAQAFYDHSFGKPYGYEAATPAYSPDGQIVLAGVGPRQGADSVVTHTLDTTLTVKKPIKNYSAAGVDTLGILSPRLSPDGTRLALNSHQLWAARRT